MKLQPDIYHVAPEHARLLMIHHLSLARSYFELVDEATTPAYIHQSLLDLDRGKLGADAGSAWFAALQAAYDEWDN